MAQTIFARVRRQLAARLTRGSVADLVTIAGTACDVLSEVAGLLFAAGGETRAPDPSRGVDAPARCAPGRAAPSPGIDRWAGRGGCFHAKHRVAAHRFRCRPPDRRSRSGPAGIAPAAVPVKKYQA
jgi:hypothetical protein